VSAETIFRALGGQRQGAGFVVHCPISSHGQGRGDRSPSLSVCDGESGRLLVYCHAGCDYRDVLHELRRRGLLESLRRYEDYPGAKTLETSRRREARVEAERNQASARRIIAGLQPLSGTHGERYLTEIRRIETSAIRDLLERVDAIGWHPSVCFNQPDPAKPNHEFHGQRLGAIIGIMTDAVTMRPTGAISRTYITADLRKVGKAKTLGNPRGIIRLSRDEDVAEGLHLAEGLETALTVIAKFQLRPTWAAGDTDIMRSFPLLGGIGYITLAADHDRKGQGEAAARDVANRWREAGREARILLPTEIGDLNDVVRRDA
jgi:hypothetical protein